MASLKVRIKINNFCENNCWYCSAADEKNNIDINPELFKEIMNKVKIIFDGGNWKRIKLVLTGGDPFKSEKILDLADMALDILGERVLKGTLTSDICYYSNIDTVKKLNAKSKNIMHLIGLNESPLDRMVEIMQEIGLDRCIALNIILTKYNISRIDSIINSVIKYKLPARLVELYDPHDSQNVVEKSQPVIDKFFTTLIENNHPINLYNYLYSNVTPKKYRAPSFCGYGKDNIYIDVHGNTRRCQNEKTIGHFLETDIMDKIQQNEVVIHEKCKSCSVFSLCKGGCPYTNKYMKYCESHFRACNYIKSIGEKYNAGNR